MRIAPIFPTLFASALSLSALGQNLVTNPSFTVDISNWFLANPVMSTPGYVFQRCTNCGTGAGDGAVDLRYSYPTGASGGELSIWTNCIPITPNTMIQFGGYFNFANAPPTGSHTYGLLVYDTMNCTMGFTGSFLTSPNGSPLPGFVDGVAATFTQVSGTVTTGANAHSFQVILSCNPGAQNTLARVLWDRIYVGQPPCANEFTNPVVTAPTAVTVTQTICS